MRCFLSLLRSLLVRWSRRQGRQTAGGFKEKPGGQSWLLICGRYYIYHDRGGGPRFLRPTAASVSLPPTGDIDDIPVKQGAWPGCHERFRSRVARQMPLEPVECIPQVADVMPILGNVAVTGSDYCSTTRSSWPRRADRLSKMVIQYGLEPGRVVGGGPKQGMEPAVAARRGGRGRRIGRCLLMVREDGLGSGQRHGDDPADGAQRGCRGPRRLHAEVASAVLALDLLKIG